MPPRKGKSGDQTLGSSGQRISQNPSGNDIHRRLYGIGPRNEGRSLLSPSDPETSSAIDRYQQFMKYFNSPRRHIRYENDGKETVLADTTTHEKERDKVTEHTKYRDDNQPQIIARTITRNDGTYTRSIEYHHYTEDGNLRFTEHYTQTREDGNFRLDRSIEHVGDGSRIEKSFSRNRDHSLIYTTIRQYGSDESLQWETLTKHGIDNVIDFERHIAYCEDGITKEYVKHKANGEVAYSEFQHFKPDGRLESKKHTDPEKYQLDQRFRYSGDGSLRSRERFAYEGGKLQWKDQFQYTKDGQIRSESFFEHKKDGTKASYTKEYAYTEEGKFRTITISEVATKENGSRTKTMRVDDFKYTEDGKIESIEVIETGAGGEETRYTRKPRPREEGMIELGDFPTGPHNAFTDGGGKIGHMSLDDDALDIHTGATFYIIGDSPNPWNAQIAAANKCVHGNGNASGLHYMDHYHKAYGITGTTGTTDIGNVVSGMTQHATDGGVRLPYPIVLETYNGYTHKVETRPIQDHHVVKGINDAKGGFIQEGSVGGGQGNYAFEFVAGFGNSSRVVIYPNGRRFVVVTGAQCNQSKREALVLDGVPLGKKIGYDEVEGIGLKVVPGWDVEEELRPVKSQERSSLVITGSIRKVGSTEGGISAAQCGQVSTRLLLSQGGLGNVEVREGSGDFNLVFSPGKGELPDDDMNLVYQAFIQAGKESILNAMWAGEQIKGNDMESDPLPHDRVNEIMREYGKKEKRPGVPGAEEIYGRTKQDIDDEALKANELFSDSDIDWSDANNDSSDDEGGPGRPGDQPQASRKRKRAKLLDDVNEALASPVLHDRTTTAGETRQPARKRRELERHTATTSKKIPTPRKTKNSRGERTGAPSGQNG